MNARDELIADLSRPEHAPMSDHDPRDGSCRSCPVPVWSLGAADIADALIAGGWRKIPSRAELTRHLANAEVILNTTDAQWEQPNVVEAERMADAILALMDGGSA